MKDSLDARERVALALRELYQTYGYRQYRMNKFEEYDLYARNRNFLSDEHILTFSDLDGKLLALKPDVTLSVIKNTRADRETRKVWYTENVYRVPRNTRNFQEIRQTGLECIGQVDLYTMSEALMLACRSLETVGRPYVLSLSHMGLLTGALAGAAPEASEAVVRAMGEKNLHGLRAACAEHGIPAETGSLLESFCDLSGPVAECLPKLLTLPLPPASRAAGEELAALCRALAAFGDFPVNLDLSVTDDTDYYNGLLFRGFVDGAARPVLSGGRYDHLLHRMGRTGSAVGFAVYLGELDRLLSEPKDYDVDVLLLYGPADDPARVAGAAKSLTDAGESVCVRPRGETAVTARRRVDVNGNEVGGTCRR